MSLISAMLLGLVHARLSQRNGEETIERRYRQYLRIEPQMRLRKNASFVLRGYPIGDEIGGGHTRSHQGGSYDSRRRNEKERYTHSILGHVDQRRPSRSQDTDPQWRISSSYGCSRTQSHWLSIGRRMYVFPGCDKTCPMGSPQTVALRTIAFDAKSNRWPLRPLSFLEEIS
jgi:hypothetical protein